MQLVEVQRRQCPVQQDAAEGGRSSKVNLAQSTETEFRSNSRYVKMEEDVIKVLRNTTRGVYYTLRLYADYKKKVSTVKMTVDKIARLSNIGRTTTIKCIKELCDLGVIQRQEGRSCYEPATYLIANEINYFTKDSENISVPIGSNINHSIKYQSYNSSSTLVYSGTHSVPQWFTKCTTVVHNPNHCGSKSEYYSLISSLSFSINKNKLIKNDFGEDKKSELQGKINRLDEDTLLEQDLAKNENPQKMDNLQQTDSINEKITKSDYRNNRANCSLDVQNGLIKKKNKTKSKLNIEPYIEIYNRIAVEQGSPPVRNNKSILKQVEKSLRDLLAELKEEENPVDFTPEYFERFLKASIQSKWFLLCEYKSNLHVLLRPKNFLLQRDVLNAALETQKLDRQKKDDNAKRQLEQEKAQEIMAKKRAAEYLQAANERKETAVGALKYPGYQSRRATLLSLVGRTV